MPSRTFRFVQASDFRLEQPPHGLAEVPDHLTDPLVESAYRAAAAVFDLALAEEVDFVVLAGNLVEPELAGPRGPTFLTEQFARLAARGIRVYWAAAPADGRRNWPITLVWPDNVHVFDSRRLERVVHLRGGEPLCVLIGRSIDELGENGSEALSGIPSDGLSDLRALGASLAIENFAVAESIAAVGSEGSSALFRIAISPVNFSAVAIEATLAALPTTAPPCFLAVGGASSSSTLAAQKQPVRMAHCSGSPQGRSIGETGPHGATLVEVDPSSTVRTAARATDTLRWHDERITLLAGAHRAEIDRRLHERMQALMAAAPEKTLLVRWTIDCPTSLVGGAHQSGLMADLLAMLRAEYGRRTPAAWSVSVAAESASALPENWYDQQTLLGEFLRAVRALEASGATPPDLHRYVPDHLRSGLSAASLSLGDPALRAAALLETAQLGAELLRPSEVAH